MTALRRLSPTVAWLLVAAALVLRLAVPAGWMPVSQGGKLTIMVCSGSNAAPVSVDLGSGEAPQPSRDPCPFGLASGAVAHLPPPIVVPAPPGWPETPRFAQPYAARLVAWRATRPPARGPPKLA